MRDFTVCSSGDECIHPKAGFLSESDYYVVNRMHSVYTYKKCKRCHSRNSMDQVRKEARKESKAEIHPATPWSIKMASSYITNGFYN